MGIAAGAMPYPFDYANMKKGDVITVEEIERLSKTKRGTPKYAFAVLGYQNQIENTMANLDKPVSTRQVRYSIEIMTDPQATKYMELSALAHERGMFRALRGLGKVNVGNLTTDEVQAHQDRIIYISRMAQGARNGRREGINLITHKRTTPLPIPPPPDGEEEPLTEENPDEKPATD
jgi:hypothetical protein